MYDKHTRGMVTARHRSLVGRGRRKAVGRDKGLAHTKQKCQKTRYVALKKNDFEHTEFPANLLDYLLRSNKSNIKQEHDSFTYVA